MAGGWLRPEAEPAWDGQYWEHTTLLPTLVMLKLMLKLCPSPSTCHTHTLQARSLVLALIRSRVKVQCRYCCVPFQMW